MKKPEPEPKPPTQEELLAQLAQGRNAPVIIINHGALSPAPQHQVNPKDLGRARAPSQKFMSLPWGLAGRAMVGILLWLIILLGIAFGIAWYLTGGELYGRF